LCQRCTRISLFCELSTICLMLHLVFTLYLCNIVHTASEWDLTTQVDTSLSRCTIDSILLLSPCSFQFISSDDRLNPPRFCRMVFREETSDLVESGMIVSCCPFSLFRLKIGTQSFWRYFQRKVFCETLARVIST
jgi:hypothetical protein